MSIHVYSLLLDWLSGHMEDKVGFGWCTVGLLGCSGDVVSLLSNGPCRAYLWLVMVAYGGY